MKKVFSIALVAISMVLASCGGAPQQAATTTKQRELKFENVTLPMTITDPTAAQKWVAENYWNKFDMADTAYIGKDVLKNAFAIYSMILVQSERQFSVNTMTNFLKKAEAQPLMHDEMVRLAEGYFGDPNSEVRNDTLFLALLDYMIESPIYDSLSKIRPAMLKEATLKNQVGDRVGDVTWTTIGGGKGSLYAVKSPMTLLMFYTPGCETCKGLFEGLNQDPTIKQAVSSGKLKLIAIYTDDNAEEWKGYAPNIGEQWLNVMSTSDFEVRKPFIIRATPSLYLLDGGKRVVVRDGVAPFQIAEALTAAN